MVESCWTFLTASQPTTACYASKKVHACTLAERQQVPSLTVGCKQPAAASRAVQLPPPLPNPPAPSNHRSARVLLSFPADASVRKTLKTQTMAAAPSEVDNFAAMARAAAISAAATAAAGMDKDSSSSRKAHTISG